MKYRELILLLESLMYDIRSHWGGGMISRAKDGRVKKCIEIVIKLSRESSDVEPNELSKVEWSIFFNRLGLYITGVYEGSILKTHYKHGGYEDLYKIHGLHLNPKNRSKWYQKELKKYQRYKLNYENEK